jgi:hypothetical protein
MLQPLLHSPFIDTLNKSIVDNSNLIHLPDVSKKSSFVRNQNDVYGKTFLPGSSSSINSLN